MLNLDEIDRIVTENLDCLAPETYQVKREVRGPSILYTIMKSGQLLGCFRVSQKANGHIDYGSIHGDGPEWNLIWESMLVRAVMRAEGKMTDAFEKNFQKDQEAYLKQIQERNANGIAVNKLTPKYKALLNKKNFTDRTGWDTTLIDMWNEGYTRNEIAMRVGRSSGRVTNRISELRHDLGEEVMPYDEERRQQRIKSRDTV